MSVVNVKFAGLGGTGVIKASDVMAELVFEQGYDFAKGEEVQSPMIPTGEADYLVVFDETQVVVNEAFLKQGGVLLTPADIDVSKLENVKALNVAMLGKLSKHFDFTVDQWTVALNKLFAEKFHEGNKKAFMLGREG